jgi:hypothetical protein
MRSILKFHRTITVLLLCLVVCASTTHLTAGLQDFTDESKKAEQSKKSGGSSSGSSIDSSDDDSVFGQLFEFIFLGWAYLNSEVDFTAYPYSNHEYRNNFITYETEPSDSQKNEAIKNGETKPGEFSDLRRKSVSSDARSWFYSVTAGYHYAGDGVKCGFAAVKGRFWKLIGPEIESRTYHDSSGNLNYTNAGICIPIVQHDYFSPDFYIGWGGFRGMMNRNGVSCGVTLSVYPVRPLILYAKAGFLSFDRITYQEYEGRLGVIANRFEIFCGYRTLYAKNVSTRLAGFESGVSVWF